ncbi:F-box domain containing protein, partial [Parasponia andersonii]
HFPYLTSNLSLNLNFETVELKRRFGLHLPEDVVEEILLRLPIESLLICKRVCKLWYNLITHPSFVNKHLRFTVQNSKLSLSSSVSLFLKWTRQELSEDDIFSGYQHGLDLSKQVLSLVTISEDIAASSNSNSASGDLLPCVIEQFSLPPVPELEQVDFPKDLVSSHCNGVICFFDRWGKNTVVWCNPALKRLKIFHTPCLLPNFESVAHGFGYDPRANVYKYVKIFSSNYYAGVSRAQLYTLGVDSWREIKIDPVQGKFCYPGSKGVYCRGVYYWLNLGVGYEMILSFDMSEEEFHTIPMPYQAEDIHRRISRIALWNESLVLLLSPQVPQVSLSLEMWVMVDGSIGVEGSTYWRKHLTIGPIANIECPLEFWKHDELLFDTSDGQIVSYNLHTQKLRKLPIPGAIYPGLTSVHLYLKSLLLV